MLDFGNSPHSISKLLTDSGATWEDLYDRIRFVSNIVKRLGLCSPSMNFKVIDGLLIYELQIATANVEEVALANEAITDAIANLPYSAIDSVTCFSCITAV